MLSSSIIHETLNTPLTWQSNLNLSKGSILGLSHSVMNVLSFRPCTHHSSHSNVFFVGASTHPGTGVPIVLAGAKITSEQILTQLGMEIPWSKDGNVEGLLDREDLGRGKGEKDIDRIQTRPLLSNIHIALLAFLVLMLAIIFQSLGSQDGRGWRIDVNGNGRGKYRA